MVRLAGWGEIVGLTQTLIRKIETAEAEALKALQKSGLTLDDVDLVASVVNNDVATASTAPRIGLESGEIDFDTITNKQILAIIAVDILACAQYARYAHNPVNGGMPQNMFDAHLKSIAWKNADTALLGLIYGNISAGLENMHIPERRTAWLKKRQSESRSSGNWYTRPLFDMCTYSIKNKHAKVDGIAETLPLIKCAEGIQSIEWWWVDGDDKARMIEGDAMDEKGVIYKLRIAGTDGQIKEMTNEQISTFYRNHSRK